MRTTAFAVLLLALAQAAQAQTYQVTDFGLFVYPQAISNNGNVVGSDATGRAFFLSRSTGMVSIGAHPGSSYSVANAVNDKGQVVGYSWSDVYPYPRRAFQWSASTGLVDLGTLPGTDESWATAINERGDVVGNCRAITGGYRGFFKKWNDPALVPLPIWTSDISDSGCVAGGDGIQAALFDPQRGVLTLGLLAESSAAYGLNNKGQVVGLNSGSGKYANYAAFVWDKRNGMVSVPYTDVFISSSLLLRINEGGTAVGYGTDQAGYYQALVWDAAHGTRNLNALLSPGSSGWDLQGAQGINARGQIVGWGYFDGAQRGFVATPIGH